MFSLIKKSYQTFANLINLNGVMRTLSNRNKSEFANFILKMFEIG